MMLYEWCDANMRMHANYTNTNMKILV
jgi:hypothetical protein